MVYRKLQQLGNQNMYQEGRIDIKEKNMPPKALLDLKGDILINEVTIGKGNLLNNTAIGNVALSKNTTGDNKTAIGNALQDNLTLLLEDLHFNTATAVPRILPLDSMQIQV